MRIFLLIGVLIFSVYGCGTDSDDKHSIVTQTVEVGNKSLQYIWIGPTKIKIWLDGKVYMLSSSKLSGKIGPMMFYFEEDGDLDLQIGDNTVEIDNPYDFDIKFPKKKKLKKNSLSSKKKLLSSSKPQKKLKKSSVSQKISSYPKNYSTSINSKNRYWSYRSRSRR